MIEGAAEAEAEAEFARSLTPDDPVHQGKVGRIPSFQQLNETAVVASPPGLMCKEWPVAIGASGWV